MKIQELGELKIPRLNAISLIKKELGFDMLSARDYLEDLLHSGKYLNEEFEEYYIKTFQKIFDNVVFFTEDEYIMDLGSSKYGMLSAEEEKENKQAQDWYNNLSDEDKKNADVYVQLNTPVYAGPTG